MTKKRPFAIYEFEPSMTKQSFAEECDINWILERARQGQDISTNLAGRIAQYGEFDNVPSYQEAMNIVRKADEAFSLLDARVRERFSNDPGRFMEFMSDDSNRDEAIKLGLVVPPAPQEPLLDAKAKASSDTKSPKAKRLEDEV